MFKKRSRKSVRSRPSASVDTEEDVSNTLQQALAFKAQSKARKKRSNAPKDLLSQPLPPPSTVRPRASGGVYTKEALKELQQSTSSIRIDYHQQQQQQQQQQQEIPDRDAIVKARAARQKNRQSKSFIPLEPQQVRHRYRQRIVVVVILVILVVIVIVVVIVVIVIVILIDQIIIVIVVIVASNVIVIIIAIIVAIVIIIVSNVIIMVVRNVIVIIIVIVVAIVIVLVSNVIVIVVSNVIVIVISNVIVIVVMVVRQDVPVEIGGRVFGVAEGEGAGAVVREHEDDEVPDVMELQRHDEPMYEPHVVDAGLEDSLDHHQQQEQEQEQMHQQESRYRNEPETEPVVEDVLSGINRHLNDQKLTLEGLHKLDASDRNTVESLQSELEDVEANMNTANMKFNFLQLFQDKVCAVLYCLKEKREEINRCEKALIELWEDRQTAMRKTRIQHWTDEEEEAFGQPSNEDERQRQIATPAPDAVDEFGRPQLHRYTVEKQKRHLSRQRRSRSRRERSVQAHDDDDDDGWTSYGDTDVERECEHERTDIIANVNAVFLNVLDEFRTPDLILQLFLTFKERHREEFDKAFCELSLPTIVSEYTRLELLRWHPIESPRLDSLSSLQKAQAAFDGALYRPLLLKIVVPFLSDTLPLLFDPFSTKQTVAVAALYKELSGHLSMEESRELRQRIHELLVGAAHSFEAFRAVPAEARLSEETSSREDWQCCFRRWNQALKLLHNMITLQHLLGTQPLLLLAQSHADARLSPLENVLQLSADADAWSSRMLERLRRLKAKEMQAIAIHC